MSTDILSFCSTNKIIKGFLIIVSDIALYNQEAVIEGIKNGTFFELLKNDVDEGRELFEKRIPAAIRAKKDYYQEALDNFIGAAKRKNVR